MSSRSVSTKAISLDANNQFSGEQLIGFLREAAASAQVGPGRFTSTPICTYGKQNWGAVRARPANGHTDPNPEGAPPSIAPMDCISFTVLRRIYAANNQLKTAHSPIYILIHRERQSSGLADVNRGITAGFHGAEPDSIC